jgi:LysR family glycine cleavage system transcriptional activator
MPLPDLVSLRCFEAAAVALNFRNAARSVALSPAALSERIAQLEDQVGEPLFLRSTRRVSLTLAGERLLPRAREAIAAARRCLEPSDAGALPFELTIGTRFELGLSWLARALASFERDRPDRIIHLRFGDSEELIDQVRKGNLDCVVSSIRLVTPGIRYEVLHEEDYALVATRRLLASRPLRTAEDAARHTLLDCLPDLPLFRYFLDARPPGERWTFGAVRYLGAISAVKHRVLEAAGVAVLPRYFATPELRARRLCEPLPEARLFSDHFRLIWRPDHPREAELRTLAAELRRRPLR